LGEERIGEKTGATEVGMGGTANTATAARLSVHSEGLELLRTKRQPGKPFR
jgi:hypothetical protein